MATRKLQLRSVPPLNRPLKAMLTRATNGSDAVTVDARIRVVRPRKGRGSYRRGEAAVD